jgi:hypothetical protein
VRRGAGFGASHSQLCAENETWLRSVIAARAKIIDIGIDKGRKEPRSPYYELEQRILAETGYPVEHRFWRSSPPYVDANYQGPCP